MACFRNRDGMAGLHSEDYDNKFYYFVPVHNRPLFDHSVNIL